LFENSTIHPHVYLPAATDELSVFLSVNIHLCKQSFSSFYHYCKKIHLSVHF